MKYFMAFTLFQQEHAPWAPQGTFAKAFFIYKLDYPMLTVILAE